MLLAIDAGNTHSVYGVWDGQSWIAVWRKSTSAQDTEDEIAAWLFSLLDSAKIGRHFDGIVCASVVPPLNHALRLLGRVWFSVEPIFLTADHRLNLMVVYDPPTAVGADRIANALGALERFEPPIVVVDFGTATTFDVIDSEGSYVGGAILPGVEVSTQSLVARTAKLPQIDFRAPERAIGRNTTESLQSGIVLGYAGAIDALATQIDQELGGGATIIATGGLGALFVGVSKSIQSYEPTLTLDGLRICYERLKN